MTVSNTTTTPKKSRWWVPVGFAALLFALLFIVFVVPNSVDPSVAAGDVADSAEEADENTDANNDNDGSVILVDDEKCPAKFVQKEVGHTNSRVDDGFAKLVADNTAEAIADGITIPEADKKTILEATGYSAHNLAIVATPLGLYAGENVLGPLVTADGKCLSERGQEVHNDLRVLLSMKGIDITRDEVPEHWYNSGINENGQFGYADEPGFYGDRDAIKITLPNGRVLYIPIRCFNIPQPGKPQYLPSSPTDNPPREVPPTDNPPPEEPPGNEPKTGPWPGAGQGTERDAGEGDHPIVVADPTPTAPVQVQTEHVATTERETVTSSNDSPGTETGTQAEGADPGTLPEGEDEPAPNEGGDPVTTTDTGGFG